MDIYGYMRRRSATRVERKPGIGGVCASRALLRTRRLRHASALVAILADESPVSCASVSTALYSASRNVLSRRTQAALTNGSSDSMNRIAAGVRLGRRVSRTPRRPPRPPTGLSLPRSRCRSAPAPACPAPRHSRPCAPAAAPVPRAAARRATPPRVPRRYPAAVPWRGSRCGAIGSRCRREPACPGTCARAGTRPRAPSPGQRSAEPGNGNKNSDTRHAGSEFTALKREEPGAIKISV